MHQHSPHIIVASQRELYFNGTSYRCAVGTNGFSTHKREGDKCTPVGLFPLRGCMYRVDKIAPPKTLLPLHVIHENEGWCDDPAHPDYNRLISVPFAGRHEKLWRADDLYDIVVPIGYNDDPVTPHRGSAIFMHIARPDYAPTEGCVALKLEDLLEILKEMGPKTAISLGQMVG